MDGWMERFDQALRTTMIHLGHKIIATAPLGLTPGQVFTLLSIKKEGQCTITRLAEKLDVKPSAMTVMLDRLENHGFVIRERDRNDRRVVMVRLTKSGEKALQNVQQLRRRAIRQCLSQLDSEELVTFLQTLEKIAALSSSLDVKPFAKTEEKGE
jgi:DNA-binding MarR family transcriptional regulator